MDQDSSIIDTIKVKDIIIDINNKFDKITYFVDTQLRSIFTDNYKLEPYFDKLNAAKDSFYDSFENAKYYMEKTNKHIIDEVIPSYEYLQGSVNNSLAEMNGHLKSIIDLIEKDK